MGLVLSFRIINHVFDSKDIQFSVVSVTIRCSDQNFIQMPATFNRLKRYNIPQCTRNSLYSYIDNRQLSLVSAESITLILIYDCNITLNLLSHRADYNSFIPETTVAIK